ncbi:MAG: hypothetical protein HY018_12825 [Hydrogenophilales bacterium]|nr:hypothetical protein [Hydrogenophilales bacterium]
MMLPNDLFDTVLVVAGVVLVVTGLVMFIRSKTSTQASSVEAFGIKLNVTHPSLILVLAGVGLMLAPRLLPEPAGKPAPAVVAEAGTPPAAVPSLPGPAATPALPPSPTPAAAPPGSPAQPAAAPPMPAPAAPVTKPSATASAIPKKPHARMASSHPAIKPAAATPPAETAITSPTAARPPRPTLVYAALGLPGHRSFWSGETRTRYTQRMHAALQQGGRDVLRMNLRALELGQAEFDAWWNESEQHPRSRELCAAAPAPLALLSARVETPTTLSAIESAYWPELRLRLFVCASQRIYRQQKTLSPQNDDAWPFAIELNSEIERFLRTYRGDLTTD